MSWTYMNKMNHFISIHWHDDNVCIKCTKIYEKMFIKQNLYFLKVLYCSCLSKYFVGIVISRGKIDLKNWILFYMHNSWLSKYNYIDYFRCKTCGRPKISVNNIYCINYKIWLNNVNYVYIFVTKIVLVTKILFG